MRIGAAGTPAAPLQAQAAAGLYVSNGKLVDANGVPFIFQVINFPYAWYTDKWSAAMGQMKARNANSVRMVLHSTRHFPAISSGTAPTGGSSHTGVMTPG
ncbi:cellulose-binding family II [Deinococcus grandis]|uniref:Cellulose-binding family II n=1 Tax=Deinococcus grandis TaxID=57498 RepID=A0A100HN40_9DEIO|nr:hypothetical protein [Deinococcus grandis]BBN96939.1 hypothetical protein DEGR_36720 [Deinococcus grandis]GAQ23778.1 cellulose-binding family II [Deinococcus grandis]